MDNSFFKYDQAYYYFIEYIVQDYKNDVQLADMLCEVKISFPTIKHILKSDSKTAKQKISDSFYYYNPNVYVNNIHNVIGFKLYRRKVYYDNNHSLIICAPFNNSNNKNDNVTFGPKEYYSFDILMGEKVLFSDLKFKNRLKIMINDNKNNNFCKFDNGLVMIMSENSIIFDELVENLYKEEYLQKVRFPKMCKPDFKDIPEEFWENYEKELKEAVKENKAKQKVKGFWGSCCG